MRSKKKTAKPRKSTLRSKKKSCEHYKKITPQTLLNLFIKSGVAIVNVLDEHNHINKKPLEIKNCYGKSFIKKSCSALNNFKLIVLYCANYTCAASRNYTKELIKKCGSKITKNIVLYEGGVNEWALLSFKFPDVFTFYNSNTNSELDLRSIEEQFLGMAHRDERRKNQDFQQIILNNQQDSSFYQSIMRDNTLCNNSELMKDKVCVVTGGTSGLGLETVLTLLNNGAKHVTLTYFHNKKRADKINKMLTSKYGKNRVYVLKADARTVQGNKLTFDRKLRKNKLKLDVGPINCVDINAGIFGPANLHKKHIHNISEKDYLETIKTNLNGYFLSLQHFAKQAIENKVKNATAVCIKSIYGSTGSLFSNTAYQISKHGVMGLVRQSAIELARPNKQLKIPYPIRVNAVSPTFTDTALTRPFLNQNAINTTLKNSNTMGHLAYKSDVAEAVMFLLSDRSRSITGIDLPVDCGVLSESIPTYEEVLKLNKSGIEQLSCCGEKL